MHAAIDQYNHIISACIWAMIHDSVTFHPFENTYSMRVEMPRVKLNDDTTINDIKYPLRKKVLMSKRSKCLTCLNFAKIS